MKLLFPCLRLHDQFVVLIMGNTPVEPIFVHDTLAAIQFGQIALDATDVLLIEVPLGFVAFPQLPCEVFHDGLGQRHGFEDYGCLFEQLIFSAMDGLAVVATNVGELFLLVARQHQSALGTFEQPLEREVLRAPLEWLLAPIEAYLLTFQPQPFWNKLLVLVWIELALEEHVAVVERIVENLIFEVTVVHRCCAFGVRRQSCVPQFLRQCLDGNVADGVPLERLHDERSAVFI